MAVRVKGFTLFEMAAVMTIIGTLAATCVTTYRRYIRMGEAAEAPLQLMGLQQLAAGHPGGPPACAASPPGVPKGTPAKWVPSPGFKALGFKPGPDTRFQYELVKPGPDGSAFLVRAIGDLDGDGETSVYELRSDQVEPTVTRGLE